MIQDRDLAELRELIDKEALRGIAARYARAIDRRDRELLLSCYHDDAIDHHGAMFRGGPLDYADWQPDVMAPFEVTAHYMLNSSYALDGDIAEGELYFIAYHRTHPPGAREMIVGGRYLDKYERRAGVWKIAYRSLVWDLSSDFAADPAQLAFLRSLGDSGCGAADVSFTALPMLAGRR